MKIKSFLQSEIILPRLKQFGVMVIYDSETRYRELCLELASDKIRVIDTSQSSISSRTTALKTLREFGQPSPPMEGVLVYVPARKPETDEQKQRDPFAIYGAVGAVFPEGDGDEFLSLCIKARADHATEIRKIFSANPNPNPSFAVIDAVGGGAGWPNLQTLLKVESARDILFSLMAPSDSQKGALVCADHPRPTTGGHAAGHRRLLRGSIPAACRERDCPRGQVRRLRNRCRTFQAFHRNPNLGNPGSQSAGCPAPPTAPGICPCA